MESKPGKPASGNSPQDDLADAGKAAKENVQQRAYQAADEAKGRAESLKSKATDQVERSASALEGAADEFEAEGLESVSRMLSSLAQNLGDFAGQIENKSVDELLHDAGRLAQRNPLLFVAGSVAAGVVLTRFFKAHSSGSRFGDEYGSERFAGYGGAASGRSQDFDRSEYEYEFDDRMGGVGSAADQSALQSGVSQPGTPGYDQSQQSSPRGGSQSTSQPSGYERDPLREQTQTPGAPLRAGEADRDESRSKRGGER
jgi:hypothetical protein